MATIAKQSAKIVQPGHVYHYGESAGCTFIKGEFVYLNAAGQLVVCADDPAVVLGMALEPATGTTNNAIAVYVAEPGVQFEMNIYSSVTAITMIGHQYSYYHDATNHWAILDNTDTANRVFEVIALSPRDAVGDTYGRVIVEVCELVAQLGQATS
jgi:hypothetical protein